MHVCMNVCISPTSTINLRNLLTSAITYLSRLFLEANTISNEFIYVALTFGFCNCVYTLRY